ncbi:MAG: hypothetical protein ABI237_18635 [Ginsengibacter sp.]
MNEENTKKEKAANSEKVAIRGILLVTLFEILAMLFFVSINL